MKRQWRKLALVFALCSGLNAPICAQRASSTPPSPAFSNLEIDVRVRYSDGSSGPGGIHVRFEIADGGPAGDCQTLPGGNCLFVPNSSGVYIARIQQSGYEPSEARVELVGTQKGYAALVLIPVVNNKTDPKAKEKQQDFVTVADLSIPEDAHRELDLGEKALIDNDLESSIHHLREAVRLYEDIPRAYCLMGVAYMERREWMPAQEALEKSIKLDPTIADAYLDLGAVYNQTKKYSQAEKTLTLGLKLKPEAAIGHYEIAKTFWETERVEEALPHTLVALSAFPNLAPAHVLLGNIRLRRNELPEAVHEYQEYLRLLPEGPLAADVHQTIQKIKSHTTAPSVSLNPLTN
jgi:Tfp pilus assembly protein PilF